MSSKEHFLDGTHKLDEPFGREKKRANFSVDYQYLLDMFLGTYQKLPVSKMTLKVWGGVPMVMGPKY